MTAPVWAAYWMVSHTDLRTNIKQLSNFNPTADYPRQMSVLEAELGQLDEVRSVITTEAYKSTDATPVYANMLFAANGYGRITIDDQSMEMIIKPLGAGQDPLSRLGGVKPSLIDLESHFMADRAQAEAEMLLAA